MSLVETVFQRAAPDFPRLITFGFQQVETGYYWQGDILEGDFRVEVTVTNAGEVAAKVIDAIDDSEYDNVNISAQQGEFVNGVREAYRAVLENIRENAFIEKSFISDQGNRLSEWIAKQWWETPDKPFDKYPETGVFRNPNNDKWYALVTTVSLGKLEPKLNGEAGKTRIEIINVKADKDSIAELHGEDGIYPAYHMNKQHWITITLDGRVADRRLFALVENSRAFTLGKSAAKNSKYPRTDAPKSWLVPANPKVFDLIKAFTEKDTILWKQGASIAIGDIVYLYYGAPYSAILYRCEVLEVDIPFDNPKPNARIKHLMRIKRLTIYEQSQFPLATLKKYGVNAIRSARGMPEELVKKLLMDN